MKTIYDKPLGESIEEMKDGILKGLVRDLYDFTDNLYRNVYDSLSNEVIADEHVQGMLELRYAWQDTNDDIVDLIYIHGHECSLGEVVLMIDTILLEAVTKCAYLIKRKNRD